MTSPVSLLENSVFSKNEVLQFRAETLGTKNVVHLNNAGSGLMPDIVTKAQLDHSSLESEIGGYEASDLRADIINDFYTQAALLFNCKASNIAFTASATDSYARALSSIRFKSGDVILTDKDDFVSNQIQFLLLVKRLNVNIIHINNALIGGVDLNDLREKLYRYQPKLLAITHIPTNSGLVQPVNEIAKIYGEYSEKYSDKTWYILDPYQSAGQMKLDIQKMKCDFLSVTCRKFLRGPRGTGALFVSDRALENGLEPMFIDMRGAKWKEKDQYEQQTTALRYEDWEFAYSTVVGSREAIKYCLAVGEEKIWQQVKLLSSFMRSKLEGGDGIRILDRGPELSSSVSFYIKDKQPGYIVNEMLKRKINVVAGYRSYGLIDFDEKGVNWVIRSSPHYYNSMNEIDHFIDAVKEII